MKSKAIISLILIAAMVLSTTIALAASWSQSSGTINSPNWQVLRGGFAGQMTSMEGVYSTAADYSNAARAVDTTSSNGSFDLTVNFKLQDNLNKTAYVGISTDAGSASNQGAWYLIGAPRNGRFMVSGDGYTPRTNTGGQPAYLSSGSATLGSHTARIVSTNGGQSAQFSIDGGTPQTVTLPGRARFVIVHLGNNGSTNPSFMDSPVVTGITFTSDGTGTPTPTPSATPTPTINYDVEREAYLQGLREYYANLPVVHMSNQSVIYNPDGTIKQVITGNQTNATATPTPTATVKPNATATPVPAQTTVTPVASPVATKTQAPGFEIILAAIGMMSALVLITRKKK